MKKQYFFLLFICSLATSAVFSQDYSPRFGAVYEYEKGVSGIKSLVGIDGEHYYISLFFKEAYFLLQYDMRHRLIAKNRLDFKLLGEKDIILDKLVHTRKGTYAIFNKFDSERSRQYLFASPFKNGELGLAQQIISHGFTIKTEVRRDISTALNYNRDLAKGLVMSSDSNYMAYAHFLHSHYDHTKEELLIAVFDADLHQLWRKNQVFEYPDDKIILEQSVVNNKGEVFILAKVLEQQPNNEILPYHFKVFKVTKDGMQSFPVVLGQDKGAVDVVLYAPKYNDEFILTGFYTDENGGLRKGLFYASEGDEEQGVSPINSFAFKDIRFAGAKQEKHNDAVTSLSNNHDIKHVFEYEDGSIGYQ